MGSTPTRRRALLAIVVLALVVRLANLAILIRLPTVTDQVEWGESDMAFGYQWSGRILDGDLLGRDAPHQYTRWMEAMAPLATWERWWGGKPIFHQAPLYAYVLAGMRLVAGDAVWRIGLCQALLGTANVALVFLLAARLFGGAVPLIAALGATFFGPFLLHEAFVLRDTLGVTTSLLLLCWLARGDRQSPAGWLVAGVLMAVAVATRETALLFVPFVLVLIRHDVAGAGTRARVTAAFVGGMALGLLPLVARNIVVGAPAFALSNRAIDSFIQGNAAGASVTWTRLPAEMQSILQAADGHLLPAIRRTIESYHGDWTRLLAHELLKLRATVSAYEGMDNVDWSYYADRSPLLHYGLRFHHVLALGLVGIVVDRTGGRRQRLLGYFMLATLGGLMYGVVIGRYRLPLAAVLLVEAAFAADWIVGRWRARRRARAALACLAAVAIAVASGHLLPPGERHLYRGEEFVMNAAGYYRRGQADAALRELRDGLDKARANTDGPVLSASYRRLLQPWIAIGHQLGRDVEAAALLEHLASEFPADAALHQALGVLYRDGLDRAADAERHFEAAKRLRGTP